MALLVRVLEAVRLGTTHYMSRRVLVDSIAYLTKEYKGRWFPF